MQVETRPVALLDVDHTLANTDRAQKNIINKILLEALKLKGIKDVFLFTDMVFTPGAIEERQKLIADLTKEGFTVHGCITPLDYLWHSSTERLKSFAEKFNMLDICLRENAPKNKDKLPTLLDEFPEVNERISSEIYPNICLAFNDATQSQQPLSDERLMQLNLHSHYCKVMIDIISQLKNTASCKGIMFRQFLAHRPAWVSECYVFDDRKDHLAAVAECPHNGFPVHTIHGEFTHNIETFTENFDPKIASEALGRRIDSVVATATNEVKAHQQEKKFSGFSKNNFDLARKYLTTILSEDGFDAKWNLILKHLKSITKSAFRTYQFSIFDTKLLQALAADKEICRKIGVTLEDDAEHSLVFLLETFSNANKDNKGKHLHTSVDSSINLPRSRTSDQIHSTTSQRFLRPRSASDAQKPKSVSTSSESSEMDKLPK